MRATHMLVTPADAKHFGARPASAPAKRRTQRRHQRTQPQRSTSGPGQDMKSIVSAGCRQHSRAVAKQQNHCSATNTLQPHEVAQPDTSSAAGEVPCRHGSSCPTAEQACSESAMHSHSQGGALRVSGLRSAPAEHSSQHLSNPQRQQDVDSLERALAALERDVHGSAHTDGSNQHVSQSHAHQAAQRSGADVRSFSASLDSLAALEAEIAAQHKRLKDTGMKLPDAAAAAALWSPSGSTLTTSDTQAGAAAPMLDAAAQAATPSCSDAQRNSPAACEPHAGPCTTRLAGTHARASAPDGIFAYSPDSVIRGSADQQGRQAESSIRDRLQQLGLSVRSHQNRSIFFMNQQHGDLIASRPARVRAADMLHVARTQGCLP